MTRGERVAWICVWSVIAAISATAAFAAWRYWALPYLYWEANICARSNGDGAALACDRVIENELAPETLRLAALRRAVEIANGRNDWKSLKGRLTLLIEMDEASSEDWNLRGWANYSLRDYENAAKDFAQAAQMNKAVGLYWSNLGDAQVEIKKYGEAYDNYTTAIKSGSETAEVLGNRGWASYQLGDYEKALTDYTQAFALDGQHADNLNERGLVRHALGDYQGALADFDRSLELKPDEPVILTNRAMTQVRIGNRDNARRDLDRAIERNPAYEAARIEKAWLLIDSSEPEGVFAELQALERNGPLSVSALEARSRAHLGLGDWQDTIADADRALALGTTFDWPYEYRAKARRGLGDFEGAIADFTVIITRNPKDISPLAVRALTLQFAGRTQAALADMSRAIADNNDPTYSYEIRSRIHLHAGHIEDALADARQAVALSPQSPYPAATLGWVLIADQEPAAAIKECSRSLTLEPTADAYACRATAELALEKIEAAQMDARLALDYDRLSGTALLVSGRAELARSRWTRAAERFSTALKFDVLNRTELFMYRGDAEAALGHLEKARSDYEKARKFDGGLYHRALSERLAKLAGQ
jgi:tetratricopeptide (TPR) repeat protein